MALARLSVVINPHKSQLLAGWVERKRASSAESVGRAPIRMVVNLHKSQLLAGRVDRKHVSSAASVGRARMRMVVNPHKSPLSAGLAGEEEGFQCWKPWPLGPAGAIPTSHKVINPYSQLAWLGRKKVSSAGSLGL